MNIPDFLNRDQLIAACPNLHLNPVIYSSIDSTSDELRRLALTGAEENTIVVARQQTNGHGRLGRCFSSPVGGLYFSLLLRPQTTLSNTLSITAAAAVAIAQTLEHHGAQKCDIKWVNDILIDGRKVCGILTQSVIVGNQKNPSFIILGVGANLLTPTSSYPVELSETADSVFKEAICSNHLFEDILSEFLNRFHDFYLRLPDAPFYEEYHKRCTCIGKSVDILKNSSHYANGTILDLERDFSLKVQLENGMTEHLKSGEISIRTN